MIKSINTVFQSSLCAFAALAAFALVASPAQAAFSSSALAPAGSCCSKDKDDKKETAYLTVEVQPMGEGCKGGSCGDKKETATFTSLCGDKDGDKKETSAFTALCGDKDGDKKETASFGTSSSFAAQCGCTKGKDDDSKKS